MDLIGCRLTLSPQSVSDDQQPQQPQEQPRVENQVVSHAVPSSQGGSTCRSYLFFVPHHYPQDGGTRPIIGWSKAMRVKTIARATLAGIKRWLAEEPSQEEPTLPFDNHYDRICRVFRQIDQVCHREAYVWGVVQGLALAKAIGYPRVSVIEFGVAGGAGLLALERIAEQAEKIVGIGIDVYGFDTGMGLPKPKDYRDLPYMWEEGSFAIDVDKLRTRLQRARLMLGLVEETVPAFVRSSFAPVAFVSIDLDLYTGTKHALGLLEAVPDALLPRIPCYFDDIMGWGYSDYTGERLAIHEFNSEHSMRKIAPHYGLKFFVPRQNVNSIWVECMYFAHIFDHPLYGARANVDRDNQLDLDGRWYKT